MEELIAEGVHGLERSAEIRQQPVLQCQEDICLSTEGARVTIETGTSWVAPWPETAVWAGGRP